MIRLLRSTWVRSLLSVTILWWLSTRIDMGEAVRAVFTVRLSHLLFVLALVGLDRVIMIYRWVLLLRASGVAITTAKAADIFLQAFAGQTSVPWPYDFPRIAQIPDPAIRELHPQPSDDSAFQP